MELTINSNDILNVKYENKPCYDIVFTNSFSDLASNISKLNIKDRKIMIVSESRVAPLYLDEVKTILTPLCNRVDAFVFKAGEESKNLDTVSDLYEKLIVNHYDRHDMLVALGGGVVGDLTGFTAATYLRGIDFIQVPTTLLSQVDSSVGGKTGVDFRAFKNMVGAFYQPKLVYINTSTLNTLNDRDFSSGMAEVIKYGIIKDKPFFQWLNENSEDILKREPSLLKQMIYISCDTKRDVVERDPKEKGERALLNLGHTIGHAVEKIKDFTLFHGECVAIGMNAAAYISLNKGYISKEEYVSILNLIEKYNLPIETDSLDVDKVVNITLNDKKMASGKIKFISIKSIGEAFVDLNVTKEDMREACEKINKN